MGLVLANSPSNSLSRSEISVVVPPFGGPVSQLLEAWRQAPLLRRDAEGRKLLARDLTSQLPLPLATSRSHRPDEL